jgi:hypothetical protein
MDALFFASTCILGGFLIFAIVAHNSNEKINKSLATDLLRGSIQNEAKNLLRLMQRNIETDGVVFFTPLKHFCNLVCYYMRLGGKFYELNEKIATITTTLASQERPIPVVRFEKHTDLEHWALVVVGRSGRQYMFNLHRADSLDMKVLGSGLK